MVNNSQGGPGPKTLKPPPGDEGFLGRWSRRKAEAALPLPAADADLSEDSHEPPADETHLPAADTEQNNQLPAAAVELPDIDEMGAGSDFSVFMQAGVPPALKTKALRKLWRVKPELVNLDGLLDYGEDLTGSFKVVDHLKTAYQVGKGFLKDDDDKKKPEAVVASAEVEAEDTEVSPELDGAEDEGEPGQIDQSADHGEVQKEASRNVIPEENLSKD